MDPRIKYFLILNAIISGMIFIYVRFFRKNEDEEYEKLGSQQDHNLVNVNYHKQTQGKDKDYKNIPILDARPEIIPDATRSINVVFTWNGHDWDAYEVLGIPAGSTIDEVHEAYEKALTRVDEKSQDFIKKAYRSICQKVS